MRVISTGNTFEIFDDNLKTYNKFPAQSYVVRFSDMRGFFMEKHPDIEIQEDKIYGVHKEKVQKVIESFKLFNRNLGVILSGDKGIGKSIFAKLLSIQAINNDIPLIVVDTYYPGIASYIESIDQEVMVLFDEFDKTFGDINDDRKASPQTGLLSLFDGVSGGKKLFVITCNSLYKISDFLINRPGRFHYHFRFEYPTPSEIEEYLKDKLYPDYYKEIKDIIAFSRKTNLNYDCLRAIAFEINLGRSFKEAISDLNIINMGNSYTKYDITLRFTNGITATTKNYPMNFFDNDEKSVWLEDSNGEEYINVSFRTSDAFFDPGRCDYIITKENLSLEYDEDDELKDSVDRIKTAEVDRLVISKCASEQIHYVL